VTRRARLRLGMGALTATLAVGAVLAADVFDAAGVLAVYVVILGALVILALTKLAQSDELNEASPFEQALRRPHEDALRPPELVRIERELVLGMESAGHLHTRLLPILREAAAARLSAKHHVELHAARALLGEEVWELLRPDRPEPEPRNARGISRTEVVRVVDVLEEL
jgi:hypothetical protein